MVVVNKLTLILFLFIVIYFWNRFAVPYITNRPISFHRKNNFDNIDRQPIKFFINNADKIIKIKRIFYWIGFVIISAMILIGIIP